MLNDDPRITFDLFTAWSNFCPNCCGNTERMLHGICRYAMADFNQVNDSWPMGLLFRIVS